MKDKVRGWVDLARIDLAAARLLSNDELLTTVVSFHAHQCIEKLFKALIENEDTLVPKIHDLDRLHHIVKAQINFDCSEEILDDLTRLYIDSRYPAMTGLMPYGVPTIPDSKRYLEFAEQLFKNIVFVLEKK